MDNKIKFSDQPKKVKIIYAAVIGVLCITAIAVGIFSAASRKPETPDDEPVVNLPSTDNNDSGEKPSETPDKGEDDKKEDEKPKVLTFVSPVVGEITKGHSLDTPVFSDTLQEWRVHTGIDISADEGSSVYASAEGTVTRVYSDPFLGKSIEISHEGGITSVYSNLDSSVAVKEGDSVKCGTLIGYVGDTSLSELADEAHLHFAIKVEGVSVNPLDYISEDSKKASLGIN